MRRTFTMLVVLPVIALVVAGFEYVAAQYEEDANKCDLRKIERHLWCANEGEFLQEGDLDEEGLCARCGGEPEQVDTCVKTGYLCGLCGSTSFEPGECPECNAEREELTVLSRIVYECEVCGYRQYEPGGCNADEQAECHGKELVKTCEHSGEFPHVSRITE